MIRELGPMCFLLKFAFLFWQYYMKLQCCILLADLSTLVNSSNLINCNGEIRTNQQQDRRIRAAVIAPTADTRIASAPEPNVSYMNS